MMFQREQPNVSEPAPTPLFSALAAESITNDWTVVGGKVTAKSFTDTAQEYQAISTGVAAVDLGAFCRYTMRGYDAGVLISSLTSAPAQEISVGESARGAMLDRDGKVIDLCDVTRLSGDIFLLTATRPCDRRIQVAARGLDVEIENITGSVAALGLFGPGSTDAAGEAGFEISTETVASHGRVRGVEAFARPATIGHAPGVEIIFPASEALVLWQRVKRASAATPAGLDACDIIRIEGGAPRVGVDFQPADISSPEDRRTPVEIGLPHLAPTNRAGFNGRRALAEITEDDGKSATRRRIVTLLLDADRGLTGADVRVAVNGRGNSTSRSVGRILSWAYSPKFKGALAMAEIASTGRIERFEVDAVEAGPVEAHRIETAEGERATAFSQRDAKPAESKGFFS